MSDPITIGTCAASALGIVAEAALKGAVAEAVKDVYGTLKKRVASWAGGDTQALENAPTSAARRAVVAEIIDAQPTADKEVIRELTAKLVAAIMVVKGDWPIGIDVDYLEAMRIRLGKITVTEGVGVRAGQVIAKNDVDIDSIKVGKNLGKRRR